VGATRKKKNNKVIRSYQLKVKLSLCLTNQALWHEGIWGSGCIDPTFQLTDQKYKKRVFQNCVNQKINNSSENRFNEVLPS
jgi:hypothetical protein